MSWVFSELRNNVSFHIPPLVQGVLGPLPSSSPLPSSPPPPYDQNFENKLSPSILLIIIILAVMFFISGLLHLLVRLLARPQRRESDDLDNVTVLQGQLQQLFHLHDAGVDQSHIDTLPVFLYKSIIGPKNPFDCAVCLCEFEPEDKLRLLPKCSHAFHLECIDTWLLSHSTCPLCRGSLLTDFSSGNCSQVVFVLQSGGESTPEIVERDVRESSFSDTGMNLEDGIMPENSQKMLTDVPAKDEPKVVPVKLGKLKMTGRGGGGGGARTESVRIGGESSSSISNVDSRRCCSMGSFEYVLDEASLLKVPIVSMRKKQSVRKETLPLHPPHRPSTSMCDVSKASHSRREGFRITDQSLQGGSAAIHEGKGESFSVSKIWLRSKKDKPFSCGDSSRRESSFRLPMGRVDSMKAHENDGPEIIEIEGCTNQDDACSSSPRSECGTDQLYHGRSSLDSLTNKTPSFARKTLHWIAGRQNRTHSAPFAPV